MLWHSNDHNPIHGAIHIHSSARPVYLTGALTESLEQSRAKLSPIELYQSVIEKGFSKPAGLSISSILIKHRPQLVIVVYSSELHRFS